MISGNFRASSSSNMEGFFTPSATGRFYTILFCLEKNLQAHPLFDLQLGRLVGQYALYDKKEHTIYTARTRSVAEFVWAGPYTPLEKSRALVAAIKNRCLDVAEFLVERGAHMSVRGYEEIIREGDVELASFLVRKLNVYVPEGVFFAARHNKIDIIKYLLEIDADAGDDNDEAIEEAIRHGHLNVVQFFLDDYNEIKPNPSPNPQDQNYNYMIIACRYGQLNIVKYLIRYINDACLPNACIQNNLQVVQYLVQTGGSDIHANVALFWAANSGHFEIVQYLLSQGASVTELSLIASINNHNYKIYHCQKFYPCLSQIKTVAN